jgi:hypothetical protein
VVGSDWEWSGVKGSQQESEVVKSRKKIVGRGP